MSANINLPGVLLPPIHLRLTATSITNIHTADDNFDVLVGMMIPNETGAPATILVDRYDGTTNNHIYSKSIGANDTAVLADMTVRLETGDIIRATAGTANALTVNLNIVKIAGRSAG
jgi:hypothetical protein